MKRKHQKGRRNMTVLDAVKNETRQKIINVLSKKQLSISQIENELKINRGTLKHHLAILKKYYIIDSKREDHLPGKPVIFFLVKEDSLKDIESFTEILKGLEESGGMLTEEKYSQLLPFSFDEPEGMGKFGATTKLMLTYPKLVENVIRITPAGEKFLKENQKGAKK